MKNPEIHFYFGKSGCGKTTVLTALALKYSRKGCEVYHNVSSLKVGTYFDSKSLGKFRPSPNARAVFLIDEVGIDFNNRQYKSLSIDVIKFVKLHRHYNSDIIIFSQALDADVTFLRMAHRVYYVNKVLFLTYTRQIKKDILVDAKTKDKPYATGQIIDNYKFKLFSTKLYLRNLYYKYFDSYQLYDDLPTYSLYSSPPTP